MTKDFSLSWHAIHRDSRALAELLRGRAPDGGWKGLIAVTRGGLVPANTVARTLDIHTVDTFCISSYDNDSLRAARILKAPQGAGTGAGWLVIDDLTDRGGTFRTLREHLPDAHYGCLYAKPEGAKTADTVLTALDQDVWVHFPWEDGEPQYVPPPAENT